MIKKGEIVGISVERDREDQIYKQRVENELDFSGSEDLEQYIRKRNLEDSEFNEMYTKLFVIKRKYLDKYQKIWKRKA